MPKKKAKPAKRLSPIQKIMARIYTAVPAAKKAIGEEKKSWDLFGEKLLLGKRLGRPVFAVTNNPTMLEHREVLQKEFDCQLMSPTEARFGADSIQKF